MNYRHSFHAGNFADLVKHALLIRLVETLRRLGPLTVLDSHAGAGLYDLTGDAARSREAEAGIARLMAVTDLPPALTALADRVRALNPDDAVTLYPGSPLLVAQTLSDQDRYVGFEMNPPILAALEAVLADHDRASAEGGDGYDGVIAAAETAPGALILIDPPFERPDDYRRSARTARTIIARDPRACVAIWTPLKDLETFDGFLRALDGSGPVLVAEARLRPLTDPMRMNGCALVVVNPPDGLEPVAREVCDWVAGSLGEAGGRGEAWWL